MVQLYFNITNTFWSVLFTKATHLYWEAHTQVKSISEKILTFDFW